MHSDPVSRCTAILTNQRACLPPTAIEGRVSHGDPMAIPPSHNGDPNQSEGAPMMRSKGVLSQGDPTAIPFSYAIKGRVLFLQ